ncbi:hypothetical protein [Altererythrobacter sp. MF3-039]|uniref:hypothetical protein n=1 Tax=Altererythrobacter sp. MF3-039 TaxID=3252901 RepID=UPI00390C885B
MSNKAPPTKPISNKEKFKPQNVRGGDKGDPALRGGKGPDTPQGSEHHLQRKSMNRR